MSSSTRKKSVLRLERTGRVIWEAPLSLQRAGLVILGTGLTALVITEVVSRYFLHLPLLWVEELCLYLLFWFYFVGAALATHDRSHIAAGVMGLVLKNKPRVLGCIHMGVIFICLGLSCMACAWSYEIFAWNFFADPRPTTIQLRLTMAYSQLSLLVGFALMSLYFLAELVGLVRERRIGNPAAGSGQ